MRVRAPWTDSPSAVADRCPDLVQRDLSPLRMPGVCQLRPICRCGKPLDIITIFFTRNNNYAALPTAWKCVITLFVGLACGPEGWNRPMRTPHPAG